MVQCFSSHPLLVTFAEPYNESFTLKAGNSQFIKLNIKSFSLKQKEVMVSCVDVNTKQLICQWLIRVQTSEPNIT